MTHEQKTRTAKRGPASPSTRVRDEAKLRCEWKPEAPNIGRSEFRRIVIDMIG